jgi:hypothetical protein
MAVGVDNIGDDMDNLVVGGTNMTALLAQAP